MDYHVQARRRDVVRWQRQCAALACPDEASATRAVLGYMLIVLGVLAMLFI